ncbi:organoarsenical effux MFS transporter ArsJ [Thalassomonas actiniarum]|uniref:Organoarsenical effux MFS transporter ArsJ n=1 Tax=Thalassomonas actiniarum TaxID=485447 RepID=A0AAE9YS65_9GAMM|nr:organoarsenical effux MFS transporter ArsJ [Thalassomonas actiniarum]WDE00251.1 organoarsenical effux MFS transporter ArsJ [Thalassomonas actiniarum]
MWSKISSLPPAVKQYLVITGNYWGFTLTDGALRMLVVLYFHQLGYAPLAIAMLFLFYEFFGVITNLVGGWLGARIGLNKTMNIGLVMQVFALLMLTVPVEYLSVFWVMLAQAISGIAKDLNKMSAKSGVKTLLPEDMSGKLFRWVALLTGSKNALKGLGFFLGGLLLALLGFRGALLLMALMLSLVAIFSIRVLTGEIGKAKSKPKFRQIFSKSAALNYLSAARLCLFAARDVWFVVALPVYLVSQLGWQHEYVGTFMAFWVIAYGLVQVYTPKITGSSKGKLPGAKLVSFWGLVLAAVTALLVVALYAQQTPQYTGVVLVTGLIVFGLVFAVNSSLHSYLILALSNQDEVSMDVGFYYMANAQGRLLGTVLSGYLFQAYGLVVCLVAASILALLAALFIRKVNPHKSKAG